MKKLTELDYDKLERFLDYRFNNRKLLLQALTHRSKSNINNERLEFLGDSILGFIISQLLFNTFKKEDEGVLTRMRASLVNKTTLSMIANELHLSEFIQLSDAETRAGGCYRESSLADAFEAIIAAVYFDSNIQQAFDFVSQIFEDKIMDIDPEISLKDPKSRLQELMQKNNYALPVYELIDTFGPAHDQTFTVACKVEAFKQVIDAKGKSRRAAEQQSAKEMLQYVQKEIKNSKSKNKIKVDTLLSVEEQSDSKESKSKTPMTKRKMTQKKSIIKKKTPKKNNPRKEDPGKENPRKENPGKQD